MNNFFKNLNFTLKSTSTKVKFLGVEWRGKACPHILPVVCATSVVISLQFKPHVQVKVLYGTLNSELWTLKYDQTFKWLKGQVRQQLQDFMLIVTTIPDFQQNGKKALNCGNRLLRGTKRVVLVRFLSLCNKKNHNLLGNTHLSCECQVNVHFWISWIH